MTTTALTTEYALLRQWLFQQALPLWSTAAVDRVNGGFFEKLMPDGTPSAEPRRARVVGRQIYCFAMAERLGWQGPARALVRHGLDFLERHILDAEGRIASVVQPDGQVVKGGFDLYDHAFVLFGLAAAASIGEQAPVLARRALRIRQRMLDGWSHPEAGFEESMPRSLPLKANPHMHMLEASLAWIETAPDAGWHLLADQIAELCLDRFIDPGTGALHEYFDGDWRRLEGHADSVVEPGHQFEWGWLLIRWGRLRNRADAIAAARRLIEIGETRGTNPGRGLAINELNADLSVRDALCRLWPQTERIKALVALAGLEPDGNAAGQAAVAASGLRRYFQHPVPGAWYEHLAPDGKPLVEPSRTSSLYHITCAINEVALAVA